MSSCCRQGRGVVLLLITTMLWGCSFAGELMPMLYAGVLASAAGFTLAAYAQRDVDPTLTSLLMSLEGVFAVIGARIFLDEHLTGRELLGCAIMFAAIIITQLPEKKKGDG